MILKILGNEGFKLKTSNQPLELQVMFTFTSYREQLWIFFVDIITKFPFDQTFIVIQQGEAEKYIPISMNWVFADIHNNCSLHTN